MRFSTSVSSGRLVLLLTAKSLLFSSSQVACVANSSDRVLWTAELSSPRVFSLVYSSSTFFLDSASSSPNSAFFDTVARKPGDAHHAALALCRVLVVPARPWAWLSRSRSSAKPALDRRFRPHPVHRLLHLPVPPVAPLHRVGRRPHQPLVQEHQRLLQARRQQLLQHRPQLLEPPQPGPQRRQLGQRRGHPAPPIEQPVDLVHQLAQAGGTAATRG